MYIIYYSVLNTKVLVLQKKWFVLFFISIFSLLTTQAQETDTLQKEKHKSMETRWLWLDIGLNQFYFSNTDIDNSPLEINMLASHQLDVNIFRQSVNLYRGKINVAYGFVLDFNRYALVNPYILRPYSNIVTADFVDSISYKKNRIQTMSFVVPLLLQYESKPHYKRQSFHLALGGFAGINVNAKNILKSSRGHKQTIKGDFNLDEFKYGLQGEIGYSYISLIYKFHLSSLFKASQSSGYVIYPMTFGLRFVPFF